MAGTINQRIPETDIFVFDKLDNGNFTYSIPFPRDMARKVAEKVPGLQVADDNSLVYMSTLRGIEANRHLTDLTAKTETEMWLPTIQEGFLLDYAGLLHSRGLIDFGIALFNGNSPDQEIAQSLVSEANQHGCELPILASFKSLDVKQGGKRYGVTPTIVSPDGLITGQDAVKALERFAGKIDSGVRGLFRSYGGWGADWGDGLDGAVELCRVGRISAEGSAQNLRDVYQSAIGRTVSAEREQYQTRIRELDAKEERANQVAESILA